MELDFFSTIFVGFIVAAVFEFIVLRILRLFMFYTTVQESTCHVYVLFGKVALVLKEPGLHFLWPKLTWKAFIIQFFGNVSVIDLRYDQVYLRSQPVNSEEGAPMGVGVWYEFVVSDPLAFLFRNSDPRGSLSANVSNSTVRCLSNLPLAKMLMDRHVLSQVVRTEVSHKSLEWGYRVGSVYIRKVHFRDLNMIREIEGKVVNRLRQVTASIKQDGDNQVHIITNTAQRTASIEFAKAGAIGPKLLGEALQEISKDPEITKALFEIIETKRIIDGQNDLYIVTNGNKILNTAQTI